jgi:hypothetical protein
MQEHESLRKENKSSRVHCSFVRGYSGMASAAEEYVTRCVESGRKRDAFYATLGTVDALEAEVSKSWPTASQGNKGVARFVSLALLQPPCSPCGTGFNLVRKGDRVLIGTSGLADPGKPWPKAAGAPVSDEEKCWLCTGCGLELIAESTLAGGFASRRRGVNQS